MTVEDFAAAFLARLDKIISLLAPRTGAPVRIALALPIRTRNGKIMANYELANDSVDDIMITVMDSSGNLVAPPPGDVFTALSSDPLTVNAMIATMPSGPNIGKTSLRINALKKLSTAPVTVTVSDADALQSDMITVDVVADATPKTIKLDVVDALHTPQAVPAS
jgi:hypothetical protein